jgi:sec-independent protein translocase protein TatC
MAAKRKYAIVGVFIAAAIFTPPDPLSQISLAVPIIILYEISIIMAKMVEKKRAAAAAEDDFNLDGEDDFDDEDDTPSGGGTTPATT